MPTATFGARRPNAMKRLMQASVLYLLWSILATIIALLYDRPAVFAGTSTGLPVFQDWLFGMGTAMSPPLGWMLVQAIFIAIAPRPSRWGRLGVAGLTLIGFTNLIGQLAEPISYEVITPATFNPILALIVAGMSILPFLMMIFGIQALSAKRRGIA